MIDAIAVSDAHLGSADADAHRLVETLIPWIRRETVRHVILAGDIGDGYMAPDATRRVMDFLRIVSMYSAADCTIHYVGGNHDEEIVEDMISAPPKVVWGQGMMRIDNWTVALHGHQWAPWTHRLVYGVLDALDYAGSTRVEQIYRAWHARSREESMAPYRRAACRLSASERSVVLHGHTHHARLGAGYVDLGCCIRGRLDIAAREDGAWHFIAPVGGAQ